MTTEQFNALAARAKAKYDRGQAEHGGLITHRDCLQELEDELIDAWFYYQADRFNVDYRGLVGTPEIVRDRAIGRLITAEWQVNNGGNEECIAPRITLLEFHLWAALDYLVMMRARRASELKGVS